VDLGGTGYGDVDWIHLTQNRSRDGIDDVSWIHLAQNMVQKQDRLCELDSSGSEYGPETG